jgi:hypothetical protein
MTAQTGRRGADATAGPFCLCASGSFARSRGLPGRDGYGRIFVRRVPYVLELHIAKAKFANYRSSKQNSARICRCHMKKMHIDKAREPTGFTLHRLKH